MADFWLPLSDESGVELFGEAWPLTGDDVRSPEFLQRVQRLADGASWPTALAPGASWPTALAALSAIVDRADDPVTEFRCLMVAADLALHREEPMAALLASKRAGDIELPDHLVHEHVEMTFVAAHSFADVGDTATALFLYRTCREQFERRGDLGGVARTDMNVAIVHGGLGDNETALALYEQSARVFDRLGDCEGLFVCMSNQVAALRGADDLDEALAVADRVVALRRNGGDDQDLAIALVNRANVLVSLERWEPARDGFIEALEINRRLGLVTEQADCLDALGTIARHDGLLEFAERMHLEALRLYERRNHPVDEAIARYNLALTLVRMGRFAEAVPLCDLASGVDGTVLDPGMVKAAALDGLGEHREAEALRRKWVDRHGSSAFARESARLS